MTINFQDMRQPNSKEEWAKLLEDISKYENTIRILNTSYIYKSFRSAIAQQFVTVNVNDGSIKLRDGAQWQSVTDEMQDSLYSALKYYVQQLNFYSKPQYKYAVSTAKALPNRNAIFEWLIEWSFHYWQKIGPSTYEALLKETSPTASLMKKSNMPVQQATKTTSQRAKYRRQTTITLLEQKIQDHNAYLAKGTLDIKQSTDFLNLYIAWVTLEIQREYIRQYSCPKQLSMQSSVLNRREDEIVPEEKQGPDGQKYPAYSVAPKLIARNTPQFQYQGISTQYDANSMLKGMENVLAYYIQYYEEICNTRKKLRDAYRALGRHATNFNIQKFDKGQKLAQDFLSQIKLEYQVFRSQLNLL